MGLTCYYDENSYLKFGIAVKEGKRGILAAEYVDDKYVTEQFLPLDEAEALKDETVELRIVTKHLERRCFYRVSGKDWRQAVVFENTRYLSSEGLKKGKRFTGACAGIYVCGRRTGSFTEFEMQD